MRFVNGTLTSTTAPGQIEPKGNSDKEGLQISQISKTGASSPDAV